MQVKNKALHLMVYALAIYILLCAFMYFNQRNLQYFPARVQDFNPRIYNLDSMQVVSTATQDGLTLQHWYAPAMDGMPTIAYFHGNAEFIGSRADRARAFMAQGFGVYMAEYRGYGVNEGNPTEAGMILDAESVMQDLKQRGVKNIVIYGESIGTGVSIQIATQYPEVKALVLEGAFTSAADVAQGIYPLIPIRFLMKDQFKSIDYVRAIKAPILFMHGSADNIISIKFGRGLFDYASEPKRWHRFEGAGHVIGFDTDGALDVVLQFLKEHKLYK